MSNQQACDNFNIIYVLREAQKVCDNYRKEEIIAFTEKRFINYLEYYHSNTGGFSFYKTNSNQYYYKMYISEGKCGPDIHGTALFMWRISIIANILKIDKELGIREIIT